MIRWKTGLALIEAEILKGLLEANGVPSRIENAHCVSLLQLQPAFAGAGADLWLDPLDQPTADRLLGDWA